MLKQAELIRDVVEGNQAEANESLDALSILELEAIAGGAVICNDH